MYFGNDLNNGLEGPQQHDAESCRSFCRSDYPSAKFFNWIGPNADWTSGHNTCWCKSSDSGKKGERGHTSGQTACVDQGDETATTTTTTLNCVTEEDTGYDGGDLSDGTTNPRQNDVESCRSFCKSDYPSATHFTWIGPNAAWTPGHNTCWCKTSNFVRKPGRRWGETSGEVSCGDQGDETTIATTTSSPSGGEHFMSKNRPTMAAKSYHFRFHRLHSQWEDMCISI